jgi:hypothetical protein
VMPFLGPVIAVWVLFALLVVACYFLFVARPPQVDDERSVPDVSAPRSRPVPQSRPVSRSRPVPVEPVAPGVEARPRWAEPAGPAASALPSYDMEDFPPERWRTSAG